MTTAHPNPEWPLLLYTHTPGATGSWGTGFLVTKEPPLPEIPTTGISAGPPLSAAEMDKLVEAQLPARSMTSSELAERDARKLASEADAEARFQDQGNWEVCVEDDARTPPSVYLVTNVHVVDGFSHVTVYFRPKHGSDFNTVTLALVDSQGRPLWRCTPSDPVISNEVPHHFHLLKGSGICVHDVAVIPLRIKDGHAKGISLPKESIEGLPFPRTNEPEVHPGRAIASAGFPLLNNVEAGVWAYREPCVVQGNIATRLPHCKEVRIIAPLMWGSSGSLVYTVEDYNGTARIFPIGVMSSITLLNHEKAIEHNIRDSGVRQVCSWELVEGLVLGGGHGYVKVVAPYPA
eukprot:Opistho-2@49010